MAAMVRDLPEAEEDLPEMDRDLRDRDLPDRDLPDRDLPDRDLPDRDLPATVTDKRENPRSSVQPRREEKLSSLA